MERPLKILFLAAGPAILPSSRTRVYNYLGYLKRAGIGYKVIRYTTKRQSRESLGLAYFGGLDRLFFKLYNLSGIFRLIFWAGRFDVVFIQKILLPKAIFSFIRRLNRNIIFDFDDAIYIVKESIARLNHTLSLSRCVIAENRYNEEYVKQFNRNTLLLATAVDAERYCPGGKINADGKVVIGWIGTPRATDYLRPLYGVFKRLSQKHPELAIQLVGASEIKIEGVPLAVKDWRCDAEAEMLQGFNIGIMPQYDTELARGRGVYKLLLYMAVGIPCVASPVGITEEVVEDGVTGFLAETEGQWFDRLSLLIEDRGLRERMGRAGRLKLERLYSYGVAAPRLIGLLEQVSKGG